MAVWQTGSFPLPLDRDCSTVPRTCFRKWVGEYGWPVLRDGVSFDQLNQKGLLVGRGRV